MGCGRQVIVKACWPVVNYSEGYLAQQTLEIKKMLKQHALVKFFCQIFLLRQSILDIMHI